MGEVSRLPSVAAVEVPAHLSEPSKLLWRRLSAEYAFDAAGEAVLRLLCEALDRCEQARQVVAEDGPMIDGRFGPRQHPMLSVERDARIAVARLIRELGLEQEQARDPLALRPRRRDQR